MIDLPTKEEARERIVELRKQAGGWTDVDGYLSPEDRLLKARAEDDLGTNQEWRDSLEQIGWFDPGSKRFCYTDTKEVHPESNAGHTIPVFVALGEQP